MQQSVSTTSVAQATFVATLVDEWRRCGVRDVVICPGSRSTPVALAFTRREDIDVFVRIDERSAGFFALGRALATRRPVAIVVTSGTAAAELHAAVAEADAAGVALVVVTADRPPELHGVGAPQTIDQRALYGSMVRAFEEPGVARLEAALSWRPLARRLFEGARGVAGRPGPVHLNAAFVEPLLAEPLTLPATRPVVAESSTPRDAAALDVRDRRVLAVVGAGTAPEVVRTMHELRWAVVGDATVSGSLAYADPLLRHDRIWEELRPDVVVRVGGVPASKFLAQRLRTFDGDILALDVATRPVADPDAVVSRRLPGLPCETEPRHHGDERYVELWRGASTALDEQMTHWWGDDLDEVQVARIVVHSANTHGVALMVGSSMPVRDVEWWSATRQGPVYANRGANGIDGVVSTFLGVAQGTSAIGLVGDITMLHDVSALVEDPGTATHAVLVVSDNHGGGIFSFLDQSREVRADRFELLFGTPRPHDLVQVARGFGHHGERVTSASRLRSAIELGLERTGLSVVVAEVPSRDVNVARHNELNERVAQWWASR